MLNRSFIGKHKGLFDMIILILYKSIQRTVNGIILAGFDFNRYG